MENIKPLIKRVFHNLKFSCLALSALYLKFCEKSALHKHNHEVNIRKSHVIPIILNNEDHKIHLTFNNLTQLDPNLCANCIFVLN